jgi:hypothetical protein
VASWLATTNRSAGFTDLRIYFVAILKSELVKSHIKKKIERKSGFFSILLGFQVSDRTVVGKIAAVL